MSELDKPSSTSETISEVECSRGRKTSDVAFIARRRQLAKLGLGAPILATLVSKPVFAGQCLSNMMSGNLSNPNRGNCSKGWSPGGWGQPGGTINGYSDAVAWSKAGFAPTGPLSGLPGALIKDSFPTGTTIIAALNPPYANTLTRHFITAYLNAALSDNDATFQYILTRQQVLDMASGVIGIPANAPGAPMNFKTFFDSTWA